MVQFIAYDLENYAIREISYEKDRLAALQGIVHYFGSILLDEPILGLWRNEFVQGLLWKADIPLKRSRRRINGVPSWSWISIDGQIRYDELCLTLGAKCRDHHVYPSAKVISASVEWTGAPMTTAISLINLTIEERLLPFRKGSSHGLESHPSVLFMLSSATEIGSCDFDIEMDPFPDKVWGFELGIIKSFRPESYDSEDGDHVTLVLTCSNGQPENTVALG